MSPLPLGILASAGAAALPAMELIETVEVSSNMTGITLGGLSSVSSTYRHLQIRYALRTGASGTTRTALLRFNSSETTYARHRLTADGVSVQTNTDFTNASQGTFGFIAGAAIGGNFGAGIIDILDPFSTSKNKTVRTFSGVAGTNGSVGIHSSVWMNTSAVTSIDILTPQPGEFLAVAGSRISLYGIRG